MIRDPRSNIDENHSSPAVIGQGTSVRSVYTLKDDCAELASSAVVLPHFICTQA